MASDSMFGTSASLRKTAKLLSDTADAMAEARKTAMSLNPPGITLGEAEHSILKENAMRDAVNKILLMAIDSTIKEVTGDLAQLQNAIQEAGKQIRKIENFKKAISIFAVLIGLAEAIVLRDPSAILTAFTKLKDTASA
ncbi:MAG TPA: hypothetical protein PLL92_04550 [Alicycliphilus sp.]|nr:hypothetical protein [Alicycliphilus sp.]